jgi:hypothetical protein
MGGKLKTLAYLLIVLAAVACAVSESYSQGSAAYGFNCIGSSSGTVGLCNDPAGSIGLRGNTATGLQHVTVEGFWAQGDAGGGDFYNLGSAATYCATNTFLAGHWAIHGGAGSTKITFSGATVSNISVGEALTLSGTGASGIQPGAEIASIDPLGAFITMTLPATGTASGTLTIAGDNGGTLIIDSEPSSGGGPGPQCWQKTNYRGDPHEFGAYGDGQTDDTTALQNWLGAYGNVSNLAPLTAPPNFGPWNASIPANYLVTAPLICPDNALIQGLATQITGTANGGAPVVRIFAARQTNQNLSQPRFVGPVVLTLGNYCRLSGMTVDGSGQQMNGTTHGTATIDNLASTANIQVGDIVTAADLPPGVTVSTIVSSTSVTITGGLPSGSNSELVSFNGPSGVAIDGKRDTIDGHSLIENGFNNVFCINTNDVQAGLQLKDAQFTRSGSDGLSLGGCPNVRVIGDVIQGSGGEAIRYGGTDITISNNAIEQSAGTGLDLTHAGKVSVSGNFFDDNGQGLNGGPAIEINNTSTASICNNHLSGNGEYASASFPSSAQIHFGGTNDGIAFCGNAYATEHQRGDATLKPSYVYDADPGTVLTNSHLYESPSQILESPAPPAYPSQQWV